MCLQNLPVSITMGQLLMSTAAAASLDFSSFIIAWVVRIHTDLLTFNTQILQYYYICNITLTVYTICC